MKAKASILSLLFTLHFSLFALSPVKLMAQQNIHVGKGSYASYTPLIKCKTDEHSGDQSRYMQNRKLFITERPG